MVNTRKQVPNGRLGAALIGIAVLVLTAPSAVRARGGQGTGASMLAQPNFEAPGGGEVNLQVTAGERAIVTTDYWTMEYDLRRGGVLDSIVFTHGSGRNLLVEPFRTFVDQWSDANAPQVSLHSSKEGNILRLEFSGRMTAADRKAGPVAFETTWTLSPFVVRADHKISFPEDLRVSSVGVASTAVRSDLGEFGLRVGPADDANERKECLATFGTTRSGGARLIDEHHAPIYMQFFNRGVEGFGLSMTSDLATWENGLTGKSGVGHYAASVSEDGGSILIVRKPLRVTAPVKVPKGEYVFSYYLGLPRIVEKADRKWRHIGFDAHPFPSDDEIRKWAESGVNIVRQDSEYYGDENFWHDGTWPPFDEKGMKELRRVIATCHRYKILVVPYFSLQELHPSAPGYAQHAQEWARTMGEVETMYHNFSPEDYKLFNYGSDYAGKGEYGAQMCPMSAWPEKLKNDVERAYRELGFDGIFYDWADTEPCNNKKHNPKLHSGIDGLIDMLAWTRRLIGPNGVLIVHQYGLKASISLENFADLVVNMEEIADRDVALRPDNIPVTTLLAESLPRSPCPNYLRSENLERNRQNIAVLVLYGMFPWAGPPWDTGETEVETLKLFRAFKPYQLETYRLHSPLSGAVHTAWEDVYGAVYAGPEQALVVISNTSREPRKRAIWTVRPEDLGFVSATKRFTVKDTKTSTVQTLPFSGLQDGSLETQLEGYEYRLFEVRSAD